MSWHQAIKETGCAILPGSFPHEKIDSLLDQINKLQPCLSGAGLRHAMKLPPVADLARHSTMMNLVHEAMGQDAFPFRATLLFKSSRSNWLVAWHQDRALPLRTRDDWTGWGPWSVKDGINYALAPAAALNQVLALRVSLDDSNMENGPLRVLPGTHTLGVLSDERVCELAASTSPAACVVPKGGILAMRPLLIHASSKSRANMPRRVLHVEYAASTSIATPFDLAIT